MVEEKDTVSESVYSHERKISLGIEAENRVKI